MTRMKMPVSINPMAPQPHRGPREGPQTLTGCGGTPSSADAKPGQTASLRGSATGPNYIDACKYDPEDEWQACHFDGFFGFISFSRRMLEHSKRHVLPHLSS